MVIKVQAPTRIDLAGGTLDMWPLYLFHSDVRTINVAIDLMATCYIEERSDSKIVLESDDIKTKEIYASLEDLSKNSELQLLSRVVDFFKPERGLNIKTCCSAPPGSGLGGSSALAIALVGALNHITGIQYNNQQLLTIAQNIETQVIAVPTGVQDYYPAMYGGLNALYLNIQGTTREPISINLALLQNNLVLCYTGKPHFSGTNNWEIFKAHIDGNKVILNLFTRLSDISSRLHCALLEEDFENIAMCLNEEWEARKSLSDGITTEQIDKLINIGIQGGASAAKVCGAGGGGCIIFLVAPHYRSHVIDSLTKAGGEILNFLLVKEGLSIEQTYSISKK